jgi:hypothetical protein
MKRKRTAAAELDKFLDALIQAIPPERHGEMRAVLREALVRTSRRVAMTRPPAPTPNDVAPETHTEPPFPQSPPTPMPSTTRARAACIADSIILNAKDPTGSPLSWLERSSTAPDD